MSDKSPPVLPRRKNMERFLRKAEIAYMLGTTPRIAAEILRQHGVSPVNFGYGRGRGLHWLESAVTTVIRDMHIAAQPKPAPAQPKTKIPHISLADLSAQELLELMRAPDTK